MADVPADLMLDARPAAGRERADDLAPGVVLAIAFLALLVAGGVVLGFVSQVTQTGVAG